MAGRSSRGGAGVQLWDWATRRVTREWRGSTGEVRAVFYPDGANVLMLPVGSTHDWNIGTGEVTGPPPFHHAPGIGSVAFSPDGRTVLINGDDGMTRLWDVATGKTLGPTVCRARTSLVAVGSGCRLLAAGGRGGRITLWEVPPPVAGTAEAVRLRVELLTGLEFDAHEAV